MPPTHAAFIYVNLLYCICCFSCTEAAGEDVIKELLSQANSDDEGTETSSSSSLTINLDGVVLESEDTGRVTELEAQLEAAHRRIKELEEQNSDLQKVSIFHLTITAYTGKARLP